MVRTIFGVIIFQDFAVPSLQNDTFNLQTGQPDRPVCKSKVYLLLNRLHGIVSRMCEWFDLPIKIIHLKCYPYEYFLIIVAYLNTCGPYRREEKINSLKL